MENINNSELPPIQTSPEPQLPPVQPQTIDIPITPPPIQEPINQNEKKTGIGFYIISIIVILFLISACYVLAFRSKDVLNLINKKKTNNITPPISQITPTANNEITPTITYTTEKNKSVLIYSEKISETNNSDRSWPVYKIYRVIDNGQPEVLVPSIGQVGEYPSTFVLSPDQQSLLINLEKRLVMVNLKTKELKEILTFENGSNHDGVTFSPNSQELFVWDQIFYNGKKNNYIIYTYDLIKKEKKVLKRETPKPNDPEFGLFVVKKWRSDNKIILEEGRGGAPLGLWIYDLKTNNIEGKGNSGWLFSNDGTIMAISSSSANDPCNLYSGDVTGSYKLIDPVSQVVKDEVKIENKIVNILAISPKNDQIIYSTKNLIDPKLVSKDWSNCEELYREQLGTEQYYIKQISGESKLISEYQSTLKTWKINLEAKQDGNQKYIQNGNQKITPSNSSYNYPLRIITQFYQ